MTWVFILSFLTGIALAQQFKVWGLIGTLVPLQLVTILIGLLRGEVWTLALAVIAVTVALQAGYLVGSIARALWQRYARRKALQAASRLGPSLSASQRASNQPRSMKRADTDC